MTMQHQIHPDDERLAALAGGDSDVVADAELSAHVSGCSRCSDFVDEMATLRTALAELPDLVPLRRLQLIPPVAEPRAAASGGWLRRLAAPVMAAGFGLVLVGAIGTSGILNQAASPGMFQNVGDNLATTQDAESTPGAQELSGGGAKTPPATREAATNATPDYASSRTNRPAPRTSAESADASVDDRAGAPADGRGSDADSDLFSVSDARLPWLVILGLGVGLLLAGLFLRFSAQPRAG